MKKRKWLYLLLIILCLAVFYGYQAMDRLSTDSKAPEIKISSEALEVSVLDPKSALLQGVTAKDEKDGDVTASLVVESIRLIDSDGTIDVSYAAFDKSGNVTKAERRARYHDYESPYFTLRSPLAFVQSSNFDVLNIIQAEDKIDGNISHRIRATPLDSASIAALGTHDVEFRVSNSLGETVKLVIPVEVYPTGSYNAGLTLDRYLVYLPVGATFNAQSYLGQFTRGLETTSLRTGLPENYSLRTSGTVDTQTPGVYSVAYTVTYTIVNEANSEYNQYFTGYSKLIVVVEG